MDSQLLPPVASESEWWLYHEELLAKEKAATRALDALAAERRRQPMVRIQKEYILEGPEGRVGLLDLFDRRRQLIIYHFMFAPEDGPCTGCSSFTDNIGNLAHLHARGASLVLVSRAPWIELNAYKMRMGWTVPWFSSHGSDFNYDFGASGQKGERFGLSAFLRDEKDVYRTYFTDKRGVDRLRIDFNLLDMTVFGRQESWEDSPEGWPQTKANWWHKHDEYQAAEQGQMFGR
jgi:predicted dithiol-disulfide oxidoreductase (DUF899 family)